MNHKLENLKGGALELLALSFLDMFPDVFLQGGQVTSWGFYYDFIMDRPFSSEFLVFLEEKMRQNSKKNFSVQSSEMVASNASSYFASLGRRDLEERLSYQEGLVSIVQIGDFVDLCSFPLPVNLSLISHFKLLEGISIAGGVRIVGCVFQEKEELKKFLKNRESLAQKGHLYLAQKEHLLKPTKKGWIWLPQGEEMRHSLASFWRREIVESGWVPISTPCRSLHEMIYFHTSLLKEGGPPTAEINFLPLEGEKEEGLLETAYGFTDRFFFPYLLQKELSIRLISSLQLIIKILKMLSFKYELILSFTGGQVSVKKSLEEAIEKSGKQANSQRGEESGFDFYVEDILGRKWKISSIRVDVQKKMVIGNVFYSQERLFALLLEQNKKDLIRGSFRESFVHF